VILEVHLFKATTFEGEPTESEEMKPEWFSTDSIPFDRMWPDDVYWFPLMLQGKKFKAYFLFEGHNKILEKKIEEVQ
jgi:8-oxo-dGTP diphosphatase/2-hydroxy-dATP diphosphatase